MSLLEKFKTVVGGGWTTAGLNVQFKAVDRVLYFQCTHGWSDWAFNLFASTVKYDEHGVEVVAHSGFAALWLSVRAEIEKLDFDVIVGYSEGAALAQAAHLNYCARRGVQPQTFAFAAPRYFVRGKGSAEVRGKVGAIAFVQNPFDLVTHTPTKAMGFTRYGENIITLPRVKRPKGEPPARWLTGHSPEQYLAALDEFEK